jgi:AraC-like DNA-binding protein
MAHTKEDERFLETLNMTIHKNIEDVELNVEKLARFMNMSRITLYRKIKAVSDLTPVELINIVRLKRAAELLADGRYKIYEVADMTGFSSQSNFTRNFLRQFSMTPTEYIQSVQAKKE